MGVSLAPTTIAAPMRTKFLTMYWPSRVKLKGKERKQTSGRRISGKKVPGIWSARRNSPRRMKRGTNKQIPIAASQMPKMGMNTSGLNQYMVLVIRSFAGLSPNTLSKPNQIKITPSEILRAGKLTVLRKVISFISKRLIGSNSLAGIPGDSTEPFARALLG